MKAILRCVRVFCRSEEGATATEYAVMIALVLLVVLVAISTLGDKVSGSFHDMEHEWSELN